MASAQKTAYHIENGPTTMYAVDADNAVKVHPLEWSSKPWTVEERNDFRRKKYEAEVEQATRENRPPPPEPEDVILSPEQQAELDEDDQRRADALKLVQEDDEKKRQEREYEDSVTTARELLKTPRIQMVDAGAPAVRPQTGPVVIPDDWREATPQKRRALAVRLGAPNTVKVDEADDYIAKAQTARGELRSAELVTGEAAKQKVTPEVS